VLTGPPLVPLYRAAGFTAGIWSFTFPWAATATLALRWLSLEHPAGQRAYAWVVIALTTMLVIGVAARTVVDIAKDSRLGRVWTQDGSRVMRG
jgi:tellurite resistance protein